VPDERTPDPRLAEWGMRLRRIREEAGLSIEALAHDAGVADALGVSPAVFFEPD
jgi:transcriptional regulator with XRE-family HTH domain